MRRWISVLAAIAFSVGVAHADDDPLHFAWVGPSTQGPSSGDSITQGLEATGQKMAAIKAQGPRTAHFDYVYPLTLAEYRATGANGVILISAVAHDPSEFPLKRAYIRLGGRDVDLVRLSRRLSEIAPPSALIDTVGKNREDEFYLLPGYLAGQEADLVLDFAANRSGFVLGHLSFKLPDGLQPAAETLPSKPNEVALRAMLAREYPGMVKP
jgi:hypothetical protein